MRFYYNSILSACINSFRHQFPDQTLKIYFFPDNHGTHTHTDILALLQRRGIVPAWLSLPSKHFPPLSDLAICESFERHSGNWQRPDVKQQLEAKIMHIQQVWHDATAAGWIDMRWQVRAIELKP
jgi:hypothetical protein